jgi:glycosyltransferase involved in cell wall biosynthesis
LPEAIRHGENGILVSNDAQEIAGAINLALADRGLARRMGAAARQTVQEKFTVERMVCRTMEIYRQVLS